MAHYNVNLPNYSIGSDCYSEIPYVARNYGKKVVAIGGKTAMAKSKQAILDGIAGSDITISDWIWYGGDSSYENGDALIQNPLVRDADIIFGIGGGRACDTCKYVADKLDKPLFNFPTVASNCASVTAICVMYYPDGSFREYYYPKIADYTFINSDIIADSPETLLWAGIGDALSKECEAVFSSKDDILDHTALLGVQLSKICSTPLIENGLEAMKAIKDHVSNKALEECTLDIIISTGLVSNMTSHTPEYYYNSSLAHCVYYGSTVTKKGHAHLHGEVVSLGVLCLLTFMKDEKERDRIMEFNAKMGLPICFDDVEITEDEFEAMADKAETTTEWAFRPKGITRKDFIDSMKEQNAIGRAYKKAMAQ